MVKFTKTEKKVLLDFLDKLSEDQSNAGCNDWEIKNTPENVELVKNVIKYAYQSKKDQKEELEYLDEQIKEKFDTIYSTDMIVLDYLIDKLKKAI
jgi:ribosomal protein S4